MTPASSLRTLVDLAQKRTETAARDLGTFNTQGREAESKFEMLLRYRQDYQARYEQSIKIGLHQAGLQNYRAFLRKLDQAIAQQQEALMRSKQQIVAGQQGWNEQRRQLKSFETLSQRRDQADSRRAAKAEQRAQDERASRSSGSGKNFSNDV